MKLIFLLAIPTFALTALAASTNNGKRARREKEMKGYDRCRKHCGISRFIINYKTGQCRCVQPETTFDLNIYTEELTGK
ncbi:hypothetical protein BDB01DRAFT_799474 [Pilobolus umbonatus]|nr:hypothetical protein BDB01DRAFT_799474 [Pilobolus umbonatus]